MRILSMTATFGKLSRQTLHLEPGMNIIQAPNEWGKSTWCAFLMAMLYGIDTGARSKTGFLAEKEHYAPWSGEPMSGSMEILWNGRQITLERQSKGRTPLGEVKAFETHTGLSVPELSVAAPGQVLLGVERSVFARAGFLRLSEMPVTEDESLRRRLNALVTTGDESGASDDLAQKLKDLKNKCRFNKKGLLPELEIQQSELEQRLQQLQTLQYQISNIQQRQQAAEQHQKLLENHKQALLYQQQLHYTQKLAAAQLARDTARETYRNALAACEGLPARDAVEQDLAKVQQLRDVRDTIHTRSQLISPMPPVPESLDAFRGKEPHRAVEDARLHRKVLQQLRKDLQKPAAYIVGGAALVLGLGLGLIGPNLAAKLGGLLALLVGVAAVFAGINKQNRLKKQIIDLQAQYRGLPEESWESAAMEYAATQKAYLDAVSNCQQENAQLQKDLADHQQSVQALTGGMSLSQFEESCRRYQMAYDRLAEQEKACQQAEEVLQALSGAGEQAVAPQFADTLEYTAQQTEELLAQTAVDREQLRQQLGQCQGQMEILGQEESLQQELLQIRRRMVALEQYYNALTRAQEFLQQATQELQRRFAPRISKRAQALFARLTNARYQRLSLGQDLSLEASAEGENTLRGTLWRSEGTVDQLYLALRLAVAEELTPGSPLVLDDALVRFDDVRLAAALDILREEAQSRQVILFTCQGREKHL